MTAKYVRLTLNKFTKFPFTDSVMVYPGLSAFAFFKLKFMLKVKSF